SSRGVAFGDFDNDGDMDILIMNVNEPPSLLRNDVSGSGHWLKVKLFGTKSNRSAIGATVIATYGGRRQAQAVSPAIRDCFTASGMEDNSCHESRSGSLHSSAARYAWNHGPAARPRGRGIAPRQSGPADAGPAFQRSRGRVRAGACRRSQ